MIVSFGFSIFVFGKAAAINSGEPSGDEIVSSIVGIATLAERSNIAHQLAVIKELLKNPTGVTSSRLSKETGAKLLPTGCTRSSDGLTTCTFYDPTYRPIAAMALTYLSITSKYIESDSGIKADWIIDEKRACVRGDVVRSIIPLEMDTTKPPILHDYFTGSSDNFEVNEPQVSHYKVIGSAVGNMDLTLNESEGCIVRMELKAKVE